MIVVFTCSLVCLHEGYAVGLSRESSALYCLLGRHSNSPGFYYVLTAWLSLCCTCEHTLGERTEPEVTLLLELKEKPMTL